MRSLKLLGLSLEGSSPSLDNRGHNLNGRMLMLHIRNLGSIPSVSNNACEAQLVEQNVEGVLVVSSNLTASNYLRGFSITVNAYDF